MGNEIAKKETPKLIKVGERMISAVGWRQPLAYEHLETHLTEESPRKQWCEITCLARTMFGRNTPANRGAARKRVARLFRYCLERGVFLIVEYDSTANGQIHACKLFDLEGSGVEERQYAAEQLRRMERRKELSEEKLSIAKQLLGSGYREHEVGHGEDAAVPQLPEA